MNLEHAATHSLPTKACIYIYIYIYGSRTTTPWITTPGESPLGQLPLGQLPPGQLPPNEKHFFVKKVIL